MGASRETFFEKAQVKSYYKSPWRTAPIRSTPGAGELLRFHPDRPHELPPLFHLRRPVSARFGGRGARLRVDADVRELLLQLRVLRDFRERGVKALDDGFGSAGSREDRVPGPHVESGQSALRQGRRAGRERRVLRAGEG